MRLLCLPVMIVMMLSIVVPACAAPGMDEMLTNLGYEVKHEGGNTYFAKDNLLVNYTHLDNENSEMLFLTRAVPDGMSDKLPSREMLIANGEIASVFLVTGTREKARNIGLVRKFPMTGLTPAALRMQIEGLVADADTYKVLLHPENWK